MTRPEACLYLVSRYPGVTHTFIVGEVRALRAAGVRVETASIRRVGRSELLSEVDRIEAGRTHAILPTNVARLARSHGRALARSPGVYLRTLARALRLSHAGGRPRLWQAFYFVESILLWDWLRSQKIRHIHVHHANVGADVALLTCAYVNASGAWPPWTWSMTIHGPTELIDVDSHKLARKVADAAAVVCISDYARSQILAFARPEDLAKLRTIRCGINIDTFRRTGPHAARAGRDRGAEILCVAALSRRKGHRVLLQAFAEARRKQPDARLTLVGDGPERAALELQAAELQLGDGVIFTGALGHDRLAALYERADIFCLPSFAEGVPIVLMEAMAMELPVVTSNVMGIPELVEHGRSGLVVPPARPDLLAQALLSLLEDPALREAMGAAGRARVARDYEIRDAVAALHAQLKPLLGK